MEPLLVVVVVYTFNNSFEPTLIDVPPWFWGLSVSALGREGLNAGGVYTWCGAVL
jgi:hypothetical protein